MQKGLKTMNRKTLIEIFDESNGIFSQIQQSNEFTWLTEDDATNLDIDYILSHSGQKHESNLVMNVMTKYEDDYMSKLSSIIILKFKEKWNRIHLALIESTYNPIENYDSHETETPNITNNRTTKSNVDLTRTTDGDVSGFNDEDYSPYNKSTEHTTGDGDNNVTSDINIESGSRQIERHGNIGVTTNQQMITQEIEMRDKFNLFEIMMNDVDSILALPIY